MTMIETDRRATGGMLFALMREVSPALARCELTHLVREPIDIARAREQHALYARTLERLGARVRQLPGSDDLPDCVFIEDTAVVVEEVAVMMRPGAASRRGEVLAVAGALEALRPLVWIQGPGCIDGGDVLRIGRQIYVGRSSRTNGHGITQLRELLEPHGYRVEGVEVRGCLHLKSAVTALSEELLLINPAWVSQDVFESCETVAVHEAEVYGANALRVGSGIVYPEHFPRTAERLEKRGLKIERVACDELAKAEGAVTCCSILVEAPGDARAPL
jgi:dimethylargininase